MISNTCICKSFGMCKEMAAVIDLANIEKLTKKL